MVYEYTELYVDEERQMCWYEIAKGKKKTHTKTAKRRKEASRLPSPQSLAYEYVHTVH